MLVVSFLDSLIVSFTNNLPHFTPLWVTTCFKLSKEFIVSSTITFNNSPFLCSPLKPFQVTTCLVDLETLTVTSIGTSVLMFLISWEPLVTIDSFFYPPCHPLWLIVGTSKTSSELALITFSSFWLLLCPLRVTTCFRHCKEVDMGSFETQKELNLSSSLLVFKSSLC